LIEIRLLGHQSVKAADGSEVLSVSAQPKRLALLVYLILSNSDADRFVSRDSVLSFFWPESDQDHSRNTLNQHIFGLRGSLGSEAILSRGGNRLGVNPERIWCDAVEFRRAIRAKEWERALNLYDGEFLAGFYVSGVPELEKWLDTQRLDCERRALEAGLALAREEKNSANWAEAVKWYRRATEIAPESESAIKGLRLAIAEAENATATAVETGGIAPAGPSDPGEPSKVGAAQDRNRWPIVLTAFATIAALLSGAWWVGQRATAGDSLPPSEVPFAPVDPSDDARPSLAVLPFVNMSADPGQEYFSDGISEEILNTLANIRGLRVAGRTSAFAYKGRNKDLREIGMELGVRYLIEGSVRKEVDQLRITAQLIDSETGSHLWSEHYDRTLESVFQIQTEIAEAIAAELRVPLGLVDPAMLAIPTTDVDAYDLYLAGRAQMRARGTGLLEAIWLFESAIELDSTWAPAWASLAEALELRIWFTETFRDGVRDDVQVMASLAGSEEAARRALALGPRNASALVALGSVQRDRGQWEESEVSYLSALALDPDSPEAHQQYSDLLGNIGRLDEAILFADRATVLDPAPIRIYELGHSLRYDGRLSEALEVFRFGIARNADMSLPRLWYAVWRASIEAGQIQESIELGNALARQLKVGPGILPLSSDPDMVAFVTGIVAGDLTRVPEYMRRLMWPVHWTMLGEPDSAVASLVRYNADMSVPYNAAIWHPGMDSIRSGSVLKTLLQDRGLADVRVRRTPPAERTRPLILDRAR